MCGRRNPLVPRFRGFADSSELMRVKSWHFDLTLHGCTAAFDASAVWRRACLPVCRRIYYNRLELKRSKLQFLKHKRKLLMYYGLIRVMTIH